MTGLAQRPVRGGMVLALRVTPRACADAVAGLYAGADGAVSLAVKVRALPDKGRANKAVIAAVAKWADLPKSALAIVAGGTDRHKRLLVTGNSAGLAALIGALAQTGKENGEDY